MQIYELTLLAIEHNDVRIRAHCSGGTYMRSIAHDLGRLLGCGAHIHELRRLGSGEFDIAQARTLSARGDRPNLFRYKSLQDASGPGKCVRRGV